MIEYEVVDMFAERPFSGSPLGVVPDAAGLSSAEMRAIAIEINATETAFVLEVSEAEATYRVRVFTPEGETEHGGHSCVGTATTLVRRGVLSTGKLIQESGTAQQVLTVTGDRVTFADRRPVYGPELDPEPLLAAAGLTVNCSSRIPARAAGFGSGFTYLPVREHELSRARPDYSRMAKDGLRALCLVSWDSAGRSAQTRLFAPGFGIPEDPACAPVAMGLGVWLACSGLLPGTGGTHGYTVRQGTEVGRPARLDCTVTAEGDCVSSGSVSGRVIPMLAGWVATLS